MGGVGHALRDLSGELLDGALALGQDVDDLRPPPARQRLRHLGEGVEEGVLGVPIGHHHG